MARAHATHAREAHRAQRPRDAQAHERELLTRELEAARGQGPRVKATPDGLTRREGQREALGWTYEVLRRDPVTSFALVVDVAQLTPGLRGRSPWS